MPAKIFAACAVRKLNSFGLLRAEMHGKRAELHSKNKKVRERMEKRIRPDFNPGSPHSFGSAKGQKDHTDIRAAWRAHVSAEGASTWGKAPIALHLLVMLSPGWPKAAGDPYSQDNKRVAALVKAVERWAEEEFGGVFAIRYDVDERSCGLVDVFVAPVRDVPGRGRYVLTNKALSQLQRRTDERKSYSAVQTSWAAYCRKHLDPEILRGEYKAKTGAEHVHADTIRKAHEDRESAEESAGFWKRAAIGLARFAQELYRLVPAFSRQKVQESWSELAEQFNLKLQPINSAARRRPPVVDQRIEKQAENAYKLGLANGLELAAHEAGEWLKDYAPDVAPGYDPNDISNAADRKAPGSLSEAKQQEAVVSSSFTTAGDEDVSTMPSASM